MSANLQTELEFLLNLPTPDLVRELQACRERWPRAAHAPVAPPPPAAPAAPATPVPPSTPATPVPRPANFHQRTKLIREFTEETIPGLEPHVDIVYATVDALRSLFALYPGASGLSELSVTVERGEPCMASELIILAATGDVEPDQGVEVNAEELKKAVEGVAPREPVKQEAT